jgi:integrase
MFPTLKSETGRSVKLRGQIENVHLAQGYLFNPFGKTKAARRKVPLTEKATGVLSRRLEKIKGDFVFPGRATDQPIVKVNAAHVGTLARINRIRLEANESAVPRFRLYDLRHTWATRAAMTGIDLVTLASMLGHEGFPTRHVHQPSRKVSAQRGRL